MYNTAIIIPCYNEENRINSAYINEVLAATSADIYFANDGSKDGTLVKLRTISELSGDRCMILDYTANEGKAATIYKSVNYLLTEKKYDFIGYFDADFSTPPPEIIRMFTELETNNHQFIFGSRVLLLNSKIERKWYRHIIGRLIITIINLKFKLKIYDTQCGAKIFSKTTATIAFKDRFYTSWLFDIEVFLRLKKEKLLHTGKELPLQQWKDIEGSKLGFKTSFKIINELVSLFKNY